MAKILVIDDEPHNVTIMTRFLSKFSFQPLVAENAEHAIQLVQTERPDVILMDLKLDQWNPPSNGLDLTRAVRKLPESAGVPVIAVSAKVMEHEKRQAIEAGCTEVVVKPVDYTSLMQKLQALTSGKEATT